jgi:hypothetical protein
MVAWAMTQAGDPYILGAEASASDPNPSAFDCSELVEWASARAGVKFVDGAYNQYSACKSAGRLVSVEDAIRIPGALLFVAKCGSCGAGQGNHVAISQGNGKTIEARGRRYGVGEFPANRKSFNYGGLIPGYNYTNRAPLQAPEMNTELAEAFLKAVQITVLLCASTKLKRGSQGECVKTVQIRLKVLGYPVTVDGKYGRGTQAAVQKFQRRNDIRSNGIVGTATWKLLYPDIV